LYAATVTNIEGDVSIRSGDADWHEAKLGEKLSAGDEIHTGPDSEVTITFSDRSFLQVGQLTEAAVGSISGPVDLPRVRVLLKMGEVAAKVNHERDRAADFAIRTPDATASVRGCEFEVSYAGKVSDVLVFQGEVEETPKNKSLKPVLLKAGQKIQVWPKKEDPIESTGGTPFP
jgi:ferric-dicitrate binding protein FerR (iron transport regulator)